MLIAYAYTLSCLQAEATGKLNLDPEMVQRLGLYGLSPAQCQVATAIWMSKPVVPTEAALLTLRIPIINPSRKVLSINTAPPNIRSRRLTKGNRVCLAPVDHYMARPEAMEALPMLK